MNKIKQMWQALKERNRKPKEIEYATNAQGKKDKHPISPRSLPIASKKQASKKGTKHAHSAGFFSRLILRDAKGKKQVRYKHRPDHDRYMPSQHERVVTLRKQRNPNYKPQ